MKELNNWLEENNFDIEQIEYDDKEHRHFIEIEVEGGDEDVQYSKGRVYVPEEFNIALF